MSRTPIGMSAVLWIACIASPSLAAFPGEPKAPRPRPPAVPELAARIDAFIDAELAARGIPPAPLASDAEFMRRVYLDLAGRIPSEQDVRAFLADKSPDRRERLVEALLGSELYVQNLADTWQGVMGPTGVLASGSLSQPIFRMWLESAVRNNVPYDHMVRELFTAQPLPIMTARNPYAIYGGQLKLVLKDKKKRPVPPNGKINLLPGPKEMAGPPNDVLRQEIADELNKSKVHEQFSEKHEKILREYPKFRDEFSEKHEKILRENPKFRDDLAEKPERILRETVIITGFVPTGPNGGSHVNYDVAVSPGMYFFEMNGYRPENLAASTARRFLGVRLECAQCHNHPFASWSRKQFWEFASFFTAVPGLAGRGRIDINEAIDIGFDDFEFPAKGDKGFNGVQKQVVNVPAAALSIAIPGTDKVVKARFLDGQAPQEFAEGRQALAEWLTSPSNPYFARTAANRLWAHFFGIGIVDPIDDEPTEENPASHPELLAELTNQFTASNFDVKYLIRAITASRAYQRASAATDPSQNAPRLFARMAVRGVRAEQLWDNIAVATGYQEPYAGEEMRVKNNAAFIGGANPARNEFVAMFASQESRTELQTSILQVLTMMNGNVMANAASLSNPKMALLANGNMSSAEKIETLYLSTLSRMPRPEETARLLRYVENQSNANAAYADVLWALLNCAEFRFNH